MTKARRILIVRNDKIGDLILALPVLQALRLAFPDAFIGWLASAYAAPLLEKDSRLNALVIDGRPETSGELKALAFDTALHLYATPKSAWLARKAGIKENIGVDGRWYSFLYSKRLPIRRSRAEKSEADYNLEHLAPLGLEAGPAEARLFLGAEAQAAADTWLKTQGLEQPFAVLHPGTGGSSFAWKRESFAELGQALRKDYGLKLLVTGSAAEGPAVDEVADACRAEARLKGGLNLPAFAAAIGKASVFCSAATGPMHVAAALGVPTLSFFPPQRSMSPRRWHPLGARRAVLSPAGLGLNIPPLAASAAKALMEKIGVSEARAAAAFLLKDARA
jgi:ADP-heptose:LPS heptosyltransferase